MLFETLDAEEFGADRRLARPERARRLFIAQAKNGQLLLAFPLRHRRDRALWRDYRSTKQAEDNLAEWLDFPRRA